MYEFVLFVSFVVKKNYANDMSFFVEHESHESFASFHSRVSAQPCVFIPEVHTSDSDVCSVKSVKSACDKRLII